VPRLLLAAEGTVVGTVPVLNVPFRLIYAINPTKDTFQPRTAFEFAVDTTF
jgi:hypothetical protein